MLSWEADLSATSLLRLYRFKDDEAQTVPCQPCPPDMVLLQHAKLLANLVILLSSSLRDDGSHCKVKTGLQAVRQPCACNTGKRRTISNLCPRRYRQPGLLFPRLVARNHRFQTKQVRSAERQFKLPLCVCFSMTCVHRCHRRHSNTYPTQTIRRPKQGLCTTKRLGTCAWVSLAAGSQHQPRSSASTPQEKYIIAGSRESPPANMLGLLLFCSGAVIKYKFMMHPCSITGSFLPVALPA